MTIAMIVAMTVAMLAAPFAIAQKESSTQTIEPGVESRSSSTPQREPYRVEASLTGGPSITFFRTPRTPQSDASHDYGGGTMLRVMWHPGRLLAFGFATGFVLLSDEDVELEDAPVTSARVVLTAIQLQLCASMQKGGFEFGAGVGPYIVRSSITDEDFSSASRMELALTGFASYDIVIDGRLRTGPALRSIYWSYRGVLTFIPEWRLRYDLVLY